MFVDIFMRFISAMFIGCLLFHPAAHAREPQISEKSYEQIQKGEAAIPLVLQMGLDGGLMNHSTTFIGEGPFSGMYLNGKALASLMLDSWIIEGGAGWGYSALYGKTASENPAEQEIGHRVYTQAGFAELGLRFRLSDKFNLGLITQDHFGTDLTFSQRKNIVRNMILAGGMAAIDLFSETGIFRIGATILSEIPNNDRRILQYGLSLQFGIPLRGYDTLLRRTDVLIRKEKVKKIEIKKIITRTVVKDVSKYSLPHDLFHFNEGHSLLQPKDQSFLLELSRVLRQTQGNYQTVTVETAVKTTGDRLIDQRLSESRAHAIRNAIVSAGLNPQRVFAKGLGGRSTLDNKPIGLRSITIVDLSFTGLSNPDTVTDELNSLFQRRGNPETCVGEKCR
jgi:flagellar motor protein MotB